MAKPKTEDKSETREDRLVKELRSRVIGNITQPGLTGDKVIRRDCDICGAEWKAGEPEIHNPGCVLA